MTPLTRRHFLEQSMLTAAAAAAAALPTALVAAETRKVSANDRITVAILGCGIRGKQHASSLAALPDCEIAYVCDPDRDRAAELAATIGARSGRAPKAVQDLRVVLDDKSVAAVFIASPNHWHALSAVWAMQAGKDVYVEKPVSHTIVEGRRIVQAARRYNRICQGGTQNRARGPLAAAVKYMAEGKLGEVKLARSILYGTRRSIGGPTQGKIPAGVDYNLWAGPATMDPITRTNFHYDWHWVWNTGDGEIGNNNIHGLDICRWGLGVTGMGRAVLSYGGRVGYSDAGETPNTQVAILDFGGKTIVTETRGLKSDPYHPEVKNGWFFFGTEGIIADTSLFDLKGKLVRAFEGKNENHFANFLQAMRTRKVADLKADILEGHQSTALIHAANISWRLGQPATPRAIEQQLGQLTVHDDVLETFARTRRHLADNNVDLEKSKLTLGPLLQIEPGQERFVGNPRANALLTRVYRKPFVLPTEQEIGA
jgi:predicted dehydrogenase